MRLSHSSLSKAIHPLTDLTAYMERVGASPSTIRAYVPAVREVLVRAGCERDQLPTPEEVAAILISTPLQRIGHVSAGWRVYIEMLSAEFADNQEFVAYLNTLIPPPRETREARVSRAVVKDTTLRAIAVVMTVSSGCAHPLTPDYIPGLYWQHVTCFDSWAVTIEARKTPSSRLVQFTYDLSDSALAAAWKTIEARTIRAHGWPVFPTHSRGSAPLSADSAKSILKGYIDAENARLRKLSNMP